MADQVEKLSIIIDADGARLSNGMKLAAADVRDLGKRLTESAKDMEDTGKAADGLGESAKKAGGHVGKLAGELAQGDWRGATTQFLRLSGALGPIAGGFGLVALAAGGIGYAMYEGAKQSKEFNNSLVLTGNYAGLVAGQLDGMAQGVARNVDASVGAARETLQALISSGRVTGDALTSAAGAVELLAHFTGRTRAEVVKDFEGMADGVAKWAAKHNESYHFLSFTQYQHIKDLEEQGRASEAMRITSEALASHLGGSLTASLGTAERAWNSLKKAGSSAWDAMLGIGRTQTLDDRLADAADRVERAARRVAAAKNAGMLGGGTGAQDELNNAMSAQSVVQSDARQAKAAAARQAEAAQEAAAQIKAADALDKRRQALDKNLRLEKELRDFRAEVKTMAGTSGEVGAAEQARMEQQIRDKYADKAGGRHGGSTSQAQRLADEMAQDTAKLLFTAQQAADSIEKSPAMQAYRRALAELEAGKESIDAINKAKGSSAERAAALSAREAKKEALRTNLNAGLDAEFNAADKSQGEKAVKDAARHREESRQADIKGMQDLDAQTRSMNANAIKDERERAQALLAIEGERWTDLIGKYEVGDSRRREIEDKYQNWLLAKNKALDEQLKPAWQKMLDGWKDTNRLMKESYDSTMESMLRNGEDEFVRSSGNIVNVGRSMVTQLENELLRLVYRRYMAGAVSQAGNALFGAVEGIFNGLSGGGGMTVQTESQMGAGFANYMAGVKHTGGIVGGDGGWSRSVNPAVFRGAPRFHTGGIVGGEEPIIAKRGEGVFTPGQMAAMGGGNQAITVNVYPTAGQTASVTQKQTGSGMTVDVMLRQVEEAIAGNVSAGAGPISRAMEGRYGLRTAVN